MPASFLRRFLPGLLVLVLAGAALAQDTSLATLSGQLSQAETDLQTVDLALDTRVDASAQEALRAKAVSAQQVARGVAAQLGQQLTLVEARIAGLGPVPTGGTEAPDIQAQRSSLDAQRQAIDAAIKRGRLADVEAQQLVEEIDQAWAAQFSEKLSDKVASPLTPAFWGGVLRAFPGDAERIGRFFSQGFGQLRLHGQGRFPWPALIGAGLAVLAFALRSKARRLGQAFLAEGAPGHRLRRSANALWEIVVGTLAPVLAVLILVEGSRWSDRLPDRWSDMADTVVIATFFGAFTLYVGDALLMPSRPSWRVAPIGDETADRVRPLSWGLAILSFASIVLTGFNRTVGASQAAVATTQAVDAVLHFGLIGTFLAVLWRLRPEPAGKHDAGQASASAGVGLTIVLLWLVSAFAVGALAVGYINLGQFIAQFISWAAILGSALYLAMAAAEDAATGLFTRESGLGLMVTRTLGVRGSMVDQFGILLSALLRLVLVVIAFGLLLSPFGASGGVAAMFSRLGVLAQGVQLGGVSVSPGAILRGAVVLLVGLTLARLFMRWLDARYLPATELGGSERGSVSLVAHYVVNALAVIWALASLGIGVERIALLLSALSVGIGFGLQAITQNFVSGLILLAERPIKIGDLVRVGDDEGDVKRISVRSTEIELADHSTLIVPNSDLITKAVLNKTLAGPMGRIQIRFSVPIETEIETVRSLVLAVLGEEQDIRDTPAPTIFVDSISDGRILFNCFANVVSPRAAYGARSNVLTKLLQRCRSENIPVGTVS